MLGSRKGLSHLDSDGEKGLKLVGIAAPPPRDLRAVGKARAYPLSMTRAATSSVGDD